MNQFGQILDLINTAIQAQYTAAKAAIQGEQVSEEAKLAQEKTQEQVQLTSMDIAAKQKAEATQAAQVTTSNIIIRQLAIYAGIGIVAIAILITLGVLLISKKTKSKFEYKYIV